MTMLFLLKTRLNMTASSLAVRNKYLNEHLVAELKNVFFFSYLKVM